MHKTPPSPARHHTLEMSAASCQMPGLTIISTAPRCQMLPLLAATNAATQQHSVETFIGSAAASGGGGGGNTSTLERKAHLQCLQQQQQQQQHQMKNLQTSLATATITSPATRCCNILGGVVSSAGINVNNMSQQQQQQHHHQQQQQQLTGMPQVVSGSTVGYYDAYGAAPASSLNMTGSLSRRTHMTTQHQPALNHEFVGVETLDILQGVAPGKYKIVTTIQQTINILKNVMLSNINETVCQPVIHSFTLLKQSNVFGQKFKQILLNFSNTPASSHPFFLVKPFKIKV